MEEQKTSKAPVIIKSIYFYLVSFVALMMVVFSTADTINIVLKTFIFTKANSAYYYPTVACDPIEQGRLAKDGTPVEAMSAEECAMLEERQKAQQKESMTMENQRNIVRDISMIVVGIPLFIFHWRFIRKRKDDV